MNYNRRSRAGRAFLAVALASFLAAAPALAQNVNQFELFVDCKPVDLVVEDIEAEGGHVVRGEAIRNAAEARLRSARMYDPQGPGILYIKFHDFGLVGVGLNVEFYKRVVDEYGNDGLVRTWRVGGIWFRGDDGDYISSVSRYMDRFIVEYFRANDSAC